MHLTPWETRSGVHHCRLVLVLCFSGFGRQRLWPSSWLVGNRCCHVRDDVRPAAFLQSWPRDSFWADPHGGTALSKDAKWRCKVCSSWFTDEEPEAKVSQRSSFGSCSVSLPEKAQSFLLSYRISNTMNKTIHCQSMKAVPIRNYCCNVCYPG